MEMCGKDVSKAMSYSRAVGQRFLSAYCVQKQRRVSIFYWLFLRVA